MPVVTNIDSDIGVRCFEYGEAEITRLEVKLFPKSGLNLRNMVLAVFTEVLSVGVDDDRRIIVDPGHLFLVHRDDDNHVVLLRDFLHQFYGRPVGDWLYERVPFFLLLCAKIRPVK